MKKLIVNILLIVLCISPAIAGVNFNWIDQDKQGHIAMGYICEDYLKERQGMGRGDAFVVCGIVAAGKEVADYYLGGTRDINDIIATMFGASVASFINYTVEF